MDSDGADRFCAPIILVMEKDQGSREDPALTPFVTATIEQIRYAQELRRRIERRYLENPPDTADDYWCVAAD
jgi:hypothetical protein